MVSGEVGGGGGIIGQFRVFGCNLLYLEWMGSGALLVQRTVCDWVPSLYNRNWRKIVHQLYFNKNNEIILKIKNGIRERMH